MFEYVIQNTAFLILGFVGLFYYSWEDSKAKPLILFLTIAFLAAGLSGFIELVYNSILLFMGL